MSKSHKINILITALTLIFAVLLFISYSNFSLFHFPLDDAWIHRVYSRSFFEGNGFAYNKTQEAGETSPLFAIITSVFHIMKDSDNVVLGIKFFGVSLTFLYLFFFNKSTNFFNVFLVFLLILNGKIIFAALSGMENSLLLFLWTLSVYLFRKEKYLYLALTASLFSVVRPEGLILLPIWSACYLMVRKDHKEWIKFTLILIIPFLLFALHCYSVSGHFLPNTFYVKASGFNLTEKKINDLLLIFDSFSPIGIVLSIIGIISFIRLRNDFVINVLYIFAAFLYLTLTTASRNIEVYSYYWIRWVEPPIIILILVSIVGYLEFLVFTYNNKLRPITIGILVLTIPILIKQRENFYYNRKKFHDDSVVIYKLNELPGKYLAEHLPTDAKIAVNDAGAMKYFSNRELIDILGLNDHEIALKTVDPTVKLNEQKYLLAYPMIRDSFNADPSFKEVKSFELTEDNTICNCSNSSKVVLYEK